MRRKCAIDLQALGRPCPGARMRWLAALALAKPTRHVHDHLKFRTGPGFPFRPSPDFRRFVFVLSIYPTVRPSACCEGRTVG